MKIPSVCILAALVLFAAELSAQQKKPSNWTAFRGSAGDGISADQGLPTTWSEEENIAWKTELPGAGSATPIVIGQRVYVTCYSGYNVPRQERGEQANLKLHLVALNRGTGKIEWTRDVEPKLPEQDNIRDGHGYASSTPAADGSRIFVFFGKSGVLAFDHEGKQLWRSDVGSKIHGWGSGASVLLHGDLVIVNASVESETLFALDAATGKEVWNLEGIKESWNTPILARHGNDTTLVVAIMGHVLGIEPDTGKELWRCATDIPWYMVPSLVAHENVVYAIGGRPGGGLAVKLGGSGDVTDSHRLWTSNKGGNVSSPVYHDGHLYWMHDNMGMAFCANAKTGEVIYQERIARAGQVYGSAVLADGKIFYPSREGATYVVAANPKFELLATNKLGERTTNNSSPAVAGGKLFLRNDRHAYAIGK